MRVRFPLPPSIHQSVHSPMKEAEFSVPVEKLCVFCRKMRTSHEGSESMGDWDTFECGAGHFDGSASVAFLRENILRAGQCRDYVPATSVYDGE